MQKEELSKIMDMKNSVIIATVHSKDYQKTNIAIIKYLTKEINIPGVYVTLNKPFSAIKAIFNKEKIDTKLIIFIDVITKTAGGDITKTKECLFIGTPENLSDISLSIKETLLPRPVLIDQLVFRKEEFVIKIPVEALISKPVSPTKVLLVKLLELLFVSTKTAMRPVNVLLVKTLLLEIVSISSPLLVLLIPVLPLKILLFVPLSM